MILGHKRVSSVKHYRKMSNQQMADETREVRQMMSDIIIRVWLDGVKNMNKYDKMIEENQKKSKEKIELAQRTIQDMISN